MNYYYSQEYEKTEKLQRPPRKFNSFLRRADISFLVMTKGRSAI